MATLHPQTRENLLRAMRREAFAFATYLLYATQARKHGREQLAELFEKVAEEEYFGHFAEQAQGRRDRDGGREPAFGH